MRPTIKLHKIGDIVIIGFEEKTDFDNDAKGAMRGAVLEQLKAGFKKIILDFENMENLDSSVISEFVSIINIASIVKGEVVFTPYSKLMSLFNGNEISKNFKTFGDVGVAVFSFK
ncbi:MAG: hypothetical protein AAB446_03405 [Patescibacteria group bacterium]